MNDDASIYLSEDFSTRPRAAQSPLRTLWISNRLAAALLLWPALILSTVMLFVVGYFTVMSAPRFAEGLEDGVDIADTIIAVFALDFIAMGYLALLSGLELIIFIITMATRSVPRRVRLTAAGLCLLRFCVLWLAIAYIVLISSYRDLTMMIALNTVLFSLGIFIDASQTPRLWATVPNPKAGLSRWYPGILVSVSCGAAVICGMLVYSLTIEPWATMPSMALLLVWPLKRGQRMPQLAEKSGENPASEPAYLPTPAR